MSEVDTRELAFLRDLYVETEWTQRFAALFDKYFDYDKKDGKILYVNAGTGNHVFSIREKLDEKVQIHAVCENEQTLRIAQSKASVLKANVHFTTQLNQNERFDAVFADASFVHPDELQSFVEKIAEKAEPGAQVCFFTVTSGSFGEIFSFLWEVLFNEGLGESGKEAEKLITSFLTVSEVKEIAKKAGLASVKEHRSNEIFEYATAKEMVNSVLISRFLFPEWLKFLSDEQKQGVIQMLTKIIDEEYRNMSFRFSVKATLIKGKKARNSIA
ncbi:MAG: class I SAM-dependent methyltransferase [Pyrinomonadaceae bacterium]|nr:class I SAM-dependent methyltransferase [Pyrinomonadaceae bacterium]MCX7640894.1 class I SAM-dependent methyltransferase [Pyrinomonadaceae bacterium]MDW8303924.1 class I SAM-dependent methyltransferase [Acidobacteriota bacterium]